MTTPTPTETDLAELRRLAAAATPGRWALLGCSAEHTESRNRSCYQVRAPRKSGEELVNRYDKNKAFIAAANPAVLLSLLDEREALKRELDGAHAHIRRLEAEAHR